MDTLNTGGGGLRQEQREAIVDALYFCMYADNRLVLAEDKVITDWLRHAGWESTLGVADYLKAAVLKVRFAKEEPARRRELLEGIRARLADAAARETALHLCRKVISADGISSEVELRALADLRLDETSL